MNRQLLIRRAIGVGAALIAMTWPARELMRIVAAQTPDAVPVFKVDPAWPRPVMGLIATPTGTSASSAASMTS